MLKITLLACGNKMPSWVEEAVRDYSRRLREYIHLSIIEIPLLKRGKGTDLSRILDKESSALINAIPDNARVIALEIGGKSFSSEQLAATFETLSERNSHLCFLIGGPEGLSEQALARCQDRWSLSALTLPHPLVRVMLLEAIYRAWSIIHNHPYHK